LTNSQETDITTVIQRRRQHPRRTAWSRSFGTGGRDPSVWVVAIVGMPSHHSLMDSGIDCQRAIKRLTTHSHHRSKESLLSALGSTGFGAADLASGATGLTEFFGAKGLAGFSGATGLAGFSTNRLKQINLSSSSFKKAAIVNNLG